ncbi:MAG: excinuclease ABC subunit UvrC [Candidatus Doudnabacteria bacterium]|nr:excinuclease ABC subunit UvrC [Candidatus Doudnabacteria bacterium]
MDISEKYKQLKISSLPTSPGIYIYKDKADRIIYIGKAKNLRARVKQYFQNHDTRPQIPYLLKDLMSLDYTVVSSELESLYLERTLIQKHRPKYNIELRDDKSYTFLAFDYSTEIPQILITRRIEENKFEKRNFRDEGKQPPTSYQLQATHYFGPYSAAYKVREVLKTIRYIFPYCSNAKVSKKPCFYFHLHRCPGVCVGQMSLSEYKAHLEKIKLFLKGNFSQIKKELSSEMKQAASIRLFEKAARFRNQIRALELLEQKQHVILPKKVSWDVITMAFESNTYCINLFKIREGKLSDKQDFVFENHKNLAPETSKPEILQKFLETYYFETSDRPDKIYLEFKSENEYIISDLLYDRFGKKTRIQQATQQEPLSLLKISKQNAQEFLRRHLERTASESDKVQAGILQLQEILKLPVIPRRIECYDISNTQGTNPVGSMVVFENGKPAKSQYRKFKIQSKNTPDDFTMMKEMLTRRFLRSEGGLQIPNSNEPNIKKVSTAQPPATNHKSSWPIPDLVVIDGGKGQLNAALETLQKFEISNFKFQTIGLAKRIEEIFLPGKSKPIVLSHSEPALQMLQRIRDEAHRFGITFHRLLRSKQAVKSALDEIPGVGIKTKRLLKQKFGTVSNIKNTSLEELTNTVGEKLAKKIKESLS